jgi:hypothetical protein
MEIKKRALRRHHYRRRIEEFRKRFLNNWGMDEEWIDGRRLGMTVASPHPCSGPCCGNPRKWFNELTRQEKREEEAWKLRFDLW